MDRNASFILTISKFKKIAIRITTPIKGSVAYVVVSFWLLHRGWCLCQKLNDY
jgi:hypothetical protein